VEKISVKRTRQRNFFGFFGKSERFSGLLPGKPEKTRNKHTKTIFYGKFIFPEKWNALESQND